MEIILLKKVEHLGNLGDRVSVKAGYGRNFLIPKGMATEATAANIARFEERRVELERIAAEAQAGAEARRGALEGLEVTVRVKAGSGGRLFGSVGPQDIVDAVKEQGQTITRRDVRLPEGPIRQLGDHQVGVQLHADVTAQIQVHVIAS